MRSEEKQRKVGGAQFWSLRLTPPALLLTALALLLAACGYRFPGGGGFPGGIQAVYLEAEPEDTPLVRALEESLRRDSQVTLRESPAGADAVLQVKGGDITSSAAAIGESGVATEYEVTVRADYQLLRRVPGGAPEAAPEPEAGGDEQQAETAEGGDAGEAQPVGPEVIRKREGLKVTSTYPFDPATNPAAEEANKRRAGRQAAEELADRILESIKTGF